MKNHKTNICKLIMIIMKMRMCEMSALSWDDDEMMAAMNKLYFMS